VDSRTGLATLHLPSTADQVRNELRRLIIAGVLEPGRALNEKDVAEQLGVSRSPVREALQRLVAERLLVAARNKSVTVKRFTTEDVNEIYDARIAIENHAAQTVMSAGPQRINETRALLEDALVQLRAALETDDPVEVAEADLAFHQQLVRCGRNSRLTDAYLLLSAETLTCMARERHALPPGDELMQDHRDLVDALMAKDPDRMSRVIAQHLHQASSNLATSSASEPVAGATATAAQPNLADVPQPRSETTP
jgi:DNA-binding GntR family transcriptional regulator